MDEDMDLGDDGAFAEALSSMRDVRADLDYYLLILHDHGRKRRTWSVFTHFTGFSERKDRWEVRQASLVSGRKFRTLWRAPEDRWLVVHSVRDLMLYLRIGGMGLLTPDIVEYWMPGVLAPRECTPDPHDLEGFLAIGEQGAAPRAHDRAPTRKLRMEVLKRDDFRCCVCGRRPSDHVDLELAVHHVIPVEHGGPTIEPNLMTLCTTCHKGLDPHYEVRLRELAGLPGNVDTLSVNRINNVQIRDNLVKGVEFQARGIGVRGDELVMDSRELMDGLRAFRRSPT